MVLARVLYYTALFFALLLGCNALRFVRGGFFISAWAYSFPLAAVTIASFVMAQRSGNGFFLALAGLFLTVVTLVVSLLVVKTLAAAWRNAICVPE
jgi:tellurite resistance protein